MLEKIENSMHIALKHLTVNMSQILKRHLLARVNPLENI